MVRMISVFGFVFLLQTSVGAAPIAESLKHPVINSTMGQVGSQVITLRDLKMSYLIDHCLRANLTKNEFSLRRMENQSTAFNQLLLETMVFEEALQFSLGQLNREEVEKNLSLLKECQKKNSAEIVQELSRQKITDFELEKLLQKKLRARFFLKFKTGSQVIIVTDEEAKAYFDKNSVKVAGLDFKQYKDSIKQKISDEKSDERLKEWIEILKKKYKVRILKPNDELE